MLQTGDVLWVFDPTTDPQKFKMMVCLSSEDGWFLRINTLGHFRPAVPIDKARNPWLKHDSHVECNLLELDDYAIEESLRNRRNPCGQLHRDHYPAIVKALMGLPFVKQADKQKIAALLA
jgi:hypothetical protein